VTTWSIYPWLGIAAIVAATGSIIYWLYMRKKPKSP
jgi:hypothetical protein